MDIFLAKITKLKSKESLIFKNCIYFIIFCVWEFFSACVWTMCTLPIEARKGRQEKGVDLYSWVWATICVLGMNWVCAPAVSALDGRLSGTKSSASNTLSELTYKNNNNNNNNKT